VRVLVLGADGMFGHQMVPTLLGAGHEVVAATRRAPDPATAAALSGARLLAGVDARVAETVVGALGDARPDAVVNAIGIVKQRPEARHAVESIRVNSLFPHELHLLCTAVGARLVHLSTDCVFSGRTGNYTEDDVPDPVDLYGRTKLLGEVAGPGVGVVEVRAVGSGVGGHRTSLPPIARKPTARGARGYPLSTAHRRPAACTPRGR